MTVLLAKSLGINTSKEWVDSITVPAMNVNLFLTISHAEPWANDSAPPSSIDATLDKSMFWRDTVGGKKITGNDICLVVPRINWVNNTQFAAYTDTANVIFGDNFYVMSNTYSVYKCLDNNGGANSTVQPTYTAVNTTNKESDGYVWKYLTTLSTADRVKFLTSDWMPIRTLAIDDGSSQWDVQDAAIDGALDVIAVTSGGSGYTNASNLIITITGDGHGAVASANINASSQTLSFIVMTTPGSSYHFANATVSGGGGANATVRPIISPFGGHGSDPVEELGGSNVMINIQLRDTESSKLTTQNDFRQIAVLKNPLTYGTSNLFSNSVFSQAFGVAVSSGAGDYTLDEYVFQGGSLSSSTFSGRVLSWDLTNNALRLTQTAGSPSSGTLLGLTSGTSRFVVSTTNPDLVAYSGNILYIDNITPIQRANNQTENIQIVLQYG